MTESSRSTEYAYQGSGGSKIIASVDDIPVGLLAPGVRYRPVIGGRLLATHVWFDPHSVAPVHVHDEEQLVIVMEGEIEYDLEGERTTVGAGASLLIPPGVPHGARTMGSPCYEIDVFSPPRASLLEKYFSEKISE